MSDSPPFGFRGGCRDLSFNSQVAVAPARILKRDVESPLAQVCETRDLGWVPNTDHWVALLGYTGRQGTAK